MSPKKKRATKWILPVSVAFLVLFCILILSNLLVSGTQEIEGEKEPVTVSPKKNRHKVTSEPSDPMIVAPTFVKPPSSSAPETNHWDDFVSLLQFQSAYADLLSTCEGSELERLNGLLIGKASRVLSLEDLEKFALGFKDTGSLSSAMFNVGEKVGKELDWPAKIKWMQERAIDPVYQGAFVRIGMTATPEQVPELLAAAGKMSNRFLSDTLLNSIFGTGNVESIKMVIDALNTGQITSSRGNLYASASASLVLSGRLDDALDVCSMIKEDSGRSGAYRAIVMGSVRGSPSEAAAFLLRIPKESDQASVVDALVKGWASSNLEDASKWVSNLAPGIVRDKAAEEVANSVLLLNPQDALTWANSIGTDSLRKSTVSKVMDHIKITDPALWKRLSNGK